MAKQTKQMSIELVTDIKDNGELETKVYYAPTFIPFSKLISATSTLDGLGELSEMDAMKETFKVVADLYNNQFTVEQLMEGLDAREAVSVIEQNMEYLTTGITAEEEKAEQKANLKEVTK